MNNTEHYVSGTLYSKKDPRVIEIDHFDVEIAPEGELLVMYNNDKPGVIGNIGHLLGKNNINIARMHFGRESAGGTAISVVSLDTRPGTDVLDQLKALPNILSIKQISL